MYTILALSICFATFVFLLELTSWAYSFVAPSRYFELYERRGFQSPYEISHSYKAPSVKFSMQRPRTVHKVTTQGRRSKDTYGLGFEKGLRQTLIHKNISAPNQSWTSEITIDEHGRRITPWRQDRIGAAKKHIFLFGCSITFGQGVNDDETFPYYLERERKDVVTYNAAIPGTSIMEAIVLAGQRSTFENVQPLDGIGVYAMFNDHFSRFFNSTFKVGDWRYWGMEWRETSPEHFETIGKLYATNPLWLLFSKIWFHSQTAKTFNLDFPIQTPERWDQFFRAVKHLRREYWQKTKPTNPFVVLFLPSGRIPRMALEAASRAEIPFIDYSTETRNYFFEDSPYVLPDRHPSARFYENLGKTLARDLNHLF